jgi:N-acetylglutamate synthase-like GNAT family acetyltransferase
MTKIKLKATLRAAKGEDHPQIRNLVWRGRINPFGLDWKRFVVVENPDGKIVGCTQIKHHRDGSFELASLVVEPGYRGQGIARVMVENLIHSHKGDLYLMCRSTLREFYRQFGFEAVTETEMPIYFRRVSRLASIAKIIKDSGGVLLVMKRRCGEL